MPVLPCEKFEINAWPETQLFKKWELIEDCVFNKCKSSGRQFCFIKKDKLTREIWARIYISWNNKKVKESGIMVLDV